MSAGNPIRPVRFTERLLDEIEQQIEQRNRHSCEAEWTFSDFVRTACREKLEKMARSRASSKKKGKVTSEESGVPPSYVG